MVTRSSSPRPRRSPRGWVLVLVAVVLAAGAALVVSLLSTPRYRASTEVIVATGVRSIESEALVAGRADIESQVREVVGEEPELTVEVVDGTNALRFTASSSNADNAATAANVHAEVYRAPRGDSVEVVEPAAVPSDPYEPQTLRNVLLAAVAGLLIGLVAAWWARRRDTIIRSRRRLDAVAGVGNLAVIRRLPSDGASAPDASANGFDASRLEYEGARTLRAAFWRVADDVGVEVVLVTSPRAGEGRSSAAVTLAAASASAGRKVALIDADLREPNVHRVLGLRNDVGLSSVIEGRASLRTAVQRAPFERNLAVLAAGPAPAGPVDAWGSDRLGRAVAGLTSAADLVVIVAPPLLQVPEALGLDRHADAVLLVGAAGVSDRRDWVEMMERLADTDMRVVGTVFCEDR